MSCTMKHFFTIRESTRATKGPGARAEVQFHFAHGYARAPNHAKPHRARLQVQQRRGVRGQ